VAMRGITGLNYGDDQGDMFRWVHPDHVYDTLGLIKEADDTQLFGDMILGVSLWLRTNKMTAADIGFIMQPFRAVDLYGVRREVKRFGIPEKPAQIAFILSGFMEAAMRGIGR
jgi:hypothetical protein